MKDIVEWLTVMLCTAAGAVIVIATLAWCFWLFAN